MPAQVLEALTLDTILLHACGNPEDWEGYHAAPSAYAGWTRYDVAVHCVQYEIVARSREDGTYEIREWHSKDH